MTTFHSRRVLGLATALLLTAAGAQAQGKSHEAHGKGKDKAARELRTDDGRDRDRDDDRNREARRGGWDNVGTYPQDGRTAGRSGKVPPGLAKKPGGMPPGQYKKRYSTSEGSSVLRDILGRRGYPVLRTTNAGDSRYVFYRLPDGSVQRAIVSPGTDQLGFSNVPASLLREVLARLY